MLVWHLKNYSYELRAEMFVRPQAEGMTNSRFDLIARSAPAYVIFLPHHTAEPCMCKTVAPQS